jgi:hypothetical protein
MYSTPSVSTCKILRLRIIREAVIVWTDEIGNHPKVKWPIKRIRFPSGEFPAVTTIIYRSANNKRISLLVVRDDVSGGIRSIRDDEIATEVRSMSKSGRARGIDGVFEPFPSTYPPLGNSDTRMPTLHIESQKEDSWMLSEACSKQFHHTPWNRARLFVVASISRWYSHVL